MKKEVTKVPKDKCLLNYIAEMGERAEKAWIYVHQNDVAKLSKMEGTIHYYDEDDIIMYWEETDKYPTTRLIIQYEYGAKWLKIQEIQAEDIKFKKSCSDPQEIIFLEKEK